MHFLEIICTDIVFKFCRYTHVRINRGRGAITFRVGSKAVKGGHAPKAPENGTKSACYGNPIIFQKLGYLLEIRPLPKPSSWIRH